MKNIDGWIKIRKQMNKEYNFFIRLGGGVLFWPFCIDAIRLESAIVLTVISCPFTAVVWLPALLIGNKMESI